MVVNNPKLLTKFCSYCDSCWPLRNCTDLAQISNMLCGHVTLFVKSTYVIINQVVGLLFFEILFLLIKSYPNQTGVVCFHLACTFIISLHFPLNLRDNTVRHRSQEVVKELCCHIIIRINNAMHPYPGAFSVPNPRIELC